MPANWTGLARIFLDEGTQNISTGIVTHPARIYSGRVDDWGSIELSIPTPSGMPQTPRARVRIMDGPDLSWRDILAVGTPRGRKVEIKFIEDGASEASAFVAFVGTIDEYSIGPGYVEVSATGSALAWLEQRVPDVITPANFPEFDDVKSGFLPVVLGHVASRAVPAGFSVGAPEPPSATALTDKITATDATTAAIIAVDISGSGPFAGFSILDRWQQNVQNPFANALTALFAEFQLQQAAQTLVLSEVEDARVALADLWAAAKAKAIAYGAPGGTYEEVENQFLAQYQGYFGIDMALLLSAMDAAIDELGGAPAPDAEVFLPQGAIPLPNIGYRSTPSGNYHRYGAAMHRLWNVLVIYRKTPAQDIFTAVDPAEFNVTVEFRQFLEYPGQTFECTFIDFLLEQDPDTQIRMDADGAYYREAFGAMAAVGYDGVTLTDPDVAPLRNPVDGFLILKALLFPNSGPSTDYDVPEIAALHVQMADGGDDHPVLLCDGTVTESMTANELMTRFVTSLQFDFMQNRDGLLTLKRIDSEDPDRPVLNLDWPGSQSIGLINSYRERSAAPTVNSLRVNYCRDYSNGAWFEPAKVTDLVAEIAALGKVESADFDLWFVRDGVTAQAAALDRLKYLSQRSFRQTFQVPLTRVASFLELAKLIGISHRLGLMQGGYENREVKTVGIGLDLKKFVARLDTVVRQPLPFVPEGTPEEPEPGEIFYSPVTINASQIQNGPLSNFVNRIHFTDNRFRHVSFGGNVANINGYDIRPYSADLTTALTYQLLNYNATTGMVEMAVLMASANNGSVINLTYGDVDLVTDGSSASAWPTRYKGVYPFGTSSSLVLTDKTSNAQTLTNNNSVTATAGAIQGAANLVRASDQSLYATTNWIDNFPCTYAMTINMASALGTGAGAIMLDNYVDGFFSYIGLALREASGQVQAEMFTFGGGNGYQRNYNLGSNALSGNHRLVIAFPDNVNWAVYLDGVSKSLTSSAGTPSSISIPMNNGHLGGRTGSNVTFDGWMDDVLIIGDAMSADEAFTDHKLYVANSSFQTLGTEDTF